MCDKKNSALFTNTECVVLSPGFKLLNENLVLLRVPRKDNMYSVDLKNIVLSGGLTCLFAKATLDEYNLLQRGLDNKFSKLRKQTYEGKSCKFDGKADEGFFVGYSINSNAFRVFNSRTRIVEESLHITFLGNKPNVAGSGPEWLFDIDTLTKSMNYKQVVTENQTNGNAGTKESIDAGQAGKKTVPSHEYILLPLWTPDSPISSSPKRSDDEVPDDARKKSTKDQTNEGDKDDQDLRDEFEREFERLFVQGKEAEININNTNSVSAVSSSVNTTGTKDVNVNNTNNIYTASPLVNIDGLSYFNANLPDDPRMPNLED
ncbi:hypothetical protein Tco_0519758, partial [Tanacetum coccineum]